MKKQKSLLSNTKGFNLVEMAVVICIVSILLAMTTSLTPVITKFRFHTESVKFKNALVLARNWAMTKGKCVAVSVDASARTLSVESFPLSAALDCTGPQLNKQLVSLVSFDQNIYLNNFDDGNPLVFGYRGGTTRSDIASVSLFSKDMTSAVNYLIAPVTGVVRAK